MPNRVTGLRLTQENLHRLGIVIEAEVVPVLEMLGAVVKEDMKVHVHKDTHKLEKSIMVGEVEIHGHTASIKIGPSKKGWYARFLEFGTKLMGAFPFVRPARDKIRPVVKPKMRDHLKKAVKVK